MSLENSWTIWYNEEKNSTVTKNWDNEREWKKELIMLIAENSNFLISNICRHRIMFSKKEFVWNDLNDKKKCEKCSNIVSNKKFEQIIQSNTIIVEQVQQQQQQQEITQEQQQQQQQKTTREQQQQQKQQQNIQNKQQQQEQNQQDQKSSQIEPMSSEQKEDDKSDKKSKKEKHVAKNAKEGKNTSIQGEQEWINKENENMGIKRFNNEYTDDEDEDTKDKMFQTKYFALNKAILTKLVTNMDNTSLEDALNRTKSFINNSENNDKMLKILKNWIRNKTWNNTMFEKQEMLLTLKNMFTKLNERNDDIRKEILPSKENLGKWIMDSHNNFGDIFWTEEWFTSLIMIRDLNIVKQLILFFQKKYLNDKNVEEKKEHNKKNNNNNNSKEISGEKKVNIINSREIASTKERNLVEKDNKQEKMSLQMKEIEYKMEDLNLEQNKNLENWSLTLKWEEFPIHLALSEKIEKYGKKNKSFELDLMLRKVEEQQQIDAENEDYENVDRIFGIFNEVKLKLNELTLQRITISESIYVLTGLEIASIYKTNKLLCNAALSAINKVKLLMKMLENRQVWLKTTEEGLIITNNILTINIQILGVNSIDSYLRTCNDERKKYIMEKSKWMNEVEGIKWEYFSNLQNSFKSDPELNDEQTDIVLIAYKASFLKKMGCIFVPFKKILQYAFENKLWDNSLIKAENLSKNDLKNLKAVFNIITILNVHDINNYILDIKMWIKCSIKYWKNKINFWQINGVITDVIKTDILQIIETLENNITKFEQDSEENNNNNNNIQMSNEENRLWEIYEIWMQDYDNIFVILLKYLATKGKKLILYNVLWDKSDFLRLVNFYNDTIFIEAGATFLLWKNPALLDKLIIRSLEKKYIIGKLIQKTDINGYIDSKLKILYSLPFRPFDHIVQNESFSYKLWRVMLFPYNKFENANDQKGEVILSKFMEKNNITAYTKILDNILKEYDDLYNNADLSQAAFIQNTILQNIIRKNNMFYELNNLQHVWYNKWMMPNSDFDCLDRIINLSLINQVLFLENNRSLKTSGGSQAFKLLYENLQILGKNLYNKVERKTDRNYFVLV